METIVRISIGGEVSEVPEASWKSEADRLVAKHPGQIPSVERIGGVPASTGAEAPEPQPSTVPPVKASVATSAATPIELARSPRGGGLRAVSPSAPETREGEIDPVGRARSFRDAAAAIAAGFAVDPPVYDRGSRVNELGVANAKAARNEWERMPLVSENCRDHAERVRSEQREDSVCLASAVRLTPEGILEARTVDAHPNDPADSFEISEDAFSSLVTRLEIPRAGAYLRACWPALRAANVNAWVALHAHHEATAAAAAKAAGRATDYVPSDLRLRHRIARNPGAREVFAVMGPSYADLDSDKISEAIALAVHPEVRGRVTYDGRRTRWEVLFHSTVAPKHFVAGEFFRAGVIVTTDDTGGGAINGHAVAWQNLCLNLIVVQTTTTAEFAIRHVGEVDAMARKFREGFTKAQGAINHFVKAWDYAVETDEIAAVRRSLEAVDRSGPAAVREMMAGIFRDALYRDLIPVRAKTEEAVEGMLLAWDRDTSAAAGPTRAAVVNAITRYAHEGAGLDPWGEDAIQRAAGALLRRTNDGKTWKTQLGFMGPEDLRK